MARNGYEGLEEHVIVGLASAPLGKERVVAKTTWTDVTEQRILIDQGVAYYVSQEPEVEGQLIVKYSQLDAAQGPGTQFFATMYCAILFDDGSEDGKLEWVTVSFKDRVIDNVSGERVS